MSEPLNTNITTDIYKRRFEGINGQPVWFYATDAMISPHGDKPGVPIADYQRLQSDNAETGLLINGMVEGVGKSLTPQYFRDRSEEVWVVYLRHADIAVAEGGHHLTFARGGPRTVVRLDRIYGWYETADDVAPESRGLAA